MTHAELVERAEAWLRGTMRCSVVLTERQGRVGEMPDAIGWWPSGASAMVECKASRGDYFADLKKPWRRVPEIAMGAERWYLVPDGLVSVGDLPEAWGLAYAQPRRVRVIRKPAPKPDYCLVREIALLVSELRRYQLHGITYPPLPPLGRTDRVLREGP